MQFYFIGGLGGNGYHLAPLINELGFPVTFLDPYKGNDSGRKRSFVLGFKIRLDKMKRSVIGHSLGEIWLVIWLLSSLRFRL